MIFRSTSALLAIVLIAAGICFLPGTISAALDLAGSASDWGKNYLDGHAGLAWRVVVPSLLLMATATAISAIVCRVMVQKWIKISWWRVALTPAVPLVIAAGERALGWYTPGMMAPIYRIRSQYLLEMPNEWLSVVEAFDLGSLVKTGSTIAVVVALMLLISLCCKAGRRITKRSNKVTVVA